MKKNLKLLFVSLFSLFVIVGCDSEDVLYKQPTILFTEQEKTQFDKWANQIISDTTNILNVTKSTTDITLSLSGICLVESLSISDKIILSSGDSIKREITKNDKSFSDDTYVNGKLVYSQGDVYLNTLLLGNDLWMNIMLDNLICDL